MRLASILVAAAAVPLGVPAAAQGAPSADMASKPLHFGRWGVDLSARDLSVRPGDDFQRYASGKWMDTHPIAPDQIANSVFVDLVQTNEDRLRAIVLGAPKTSQIGALYASYVDEGRLEQLDAAPLQADLKRVKAITDKSQFARELGSNCGDFGALLFGVAPTVDPQDPKFNTLSLISGGMGLPSRDYYLLDKFAKQRAAYRTYIIKLLTMTGTPDAARAADEIIAFETEIARVSWPAADLRDLDKTNTPMTLSELKGYAPGFDWDAFFSGGGIHATKMVVRGNSAVQAIAALYARTPLETLKLWDRFNTADAGASYLSKRFEDAQLDVAKAMAGISQYRPRWRRGIDVVNGRLGELIGRDFVARYFPPASKAMMERLVANLKLSAADRIRENGWMSPQTKHAALEKLGKMRVMVGYPDKPRDYSALVLKSDDLYGNMKRSLAFEWQDYRERVYNPVDPLRWGLSPVTVNAYNGGLENKIVFPAGILQPPFFDPKADGAVNYGAIGAVIGHEMMHGFDDQGRKIDGNGALRDWWTPQDAARFKDRTAKLGQQYSAFEAAPGAFVNGQLTMGENIGDLSGLEVAYSAYRKSLRGKPAPVIDGLTGDQRFFLGFAQVWRGVQREEAVRQQVASNVHSPSRFRVIGPLRNLDAWYEAFHVSPNSRFYIPPKDRVHLW